MAGRFSVEAVFKAVDRITAPVAKMQRRVRKFTSSAHRGFRRLNRSVDGFVAGAKRGAIATVAALALTTGAMADVVATGAKFEQTLVNAAAKFPGEIRKGTEAFAQLEAAAKLTGKTTEFTASQSADALNFLAMAGFNAQSSIAALPVVVDLATAAQTDLATATDIATDTLGAFGLESKDVTKQAANLARVSDVLAKTSTTANTTMGQMFQAMKKGGPMATAAGHDIETVASLIGVMAGAGIKAEIAGTAVANAYLNLAAPSSKAAKILKRLGVTITDSNGKMRDMPKLIGDINRATSKLTDVQRLGVIESIFGREGLAGINKVVATGEKGLNDYRKTIRGATGASKTMASVMRDTLQGRLNSLNSTIEGVKLSIFGLTEGPLSDAIDRTIAWVRANEQLIASGVGEFFAKIINNFGEISAALKDIAFGVGAILALSLALKAVSVVLGIINLLMVANPLVLGIMAAVAAVALLSGKLDPLLDTIQSIGSGIANAFGAVSGLGKIFGFGDEGDTKANASATPQVVSPQERAARAVEEQRTTSTAEVTIRDESGRAEVTGGALGPGLALQTTGGF